MSDKPEKLITEDGLRLDGRRVDEIRPMKIEIGVLSRANGSCYLEWGKNKILVGVYGPREAHPRRTQRSDSAVIRYRYNMASFSVEDRARPGPSRRSIEISKVSREAFEPVIMAELFPKAAIDIFVEVLQADAGTRTAAINASSIALADAGIPMKGLITSCAFGKVDGQVVLDLNKDEDNYGEADFPVAMTQDGEITLLQMDGHLTQEEIKRGMELVKMGCKQILEIQQAALRTKFTAPAEEEPAGEAGAEEKAKEAEAEAAPEYALEAAILEKSIEEVVEEEEDSEEAFAEFQGTEVIPEAEEEAEAEEEEFEEETEAEEEEFEEETEAEEEEEFDEETEAEEEEEFDEEAEAEEEEEFEEETEAEEEEEEFEEETEAEEEEEFEEEAEAEEEEEFEEEAEAEEEEEFEETEAEEEEEFEEETEAEEEEEFEETEAEEEEEFEETEAEEEEEFEEETEAEEEPKAEEEETEAEEEPEGPWKVVKDPSNVESRGENNE
ncbi:exosome complex exonuclease Rrp41 [Methanosarcina sp. KYL-1]|uniref:exosome complex exonuclease Rrp41 n=1 Tax=Methanosarcina sp. KYL-1 TaxID=2602068 RepID=UPI0021015A65|nr:exosome complex exonuclease Rrp41 [Methanosarcina sp. KYL-1]MCQ1536405.1 exosome complex exonuclease Rrp41 [Methanosarcina sp. KYL-1]